MLAAVLPTSRWHLLDCELTDPLSCHLLFKCAGQRVTRLQPPAMGSSLCGEATGRGSPPALKATVCGVAGNLPREVLLKEHYRVLAV